MADNETHGDADDDAGALAVSVAEALLDMKAENARVLDVRGLTSVMDFMVLATGSGDRHVRAMSDTVRGTLREHGREILGSEGSKDSGWIVIDAADVVTHVFSRSMRRYYDLDGLWADAAEIEIGGTRAPESAEENTEGGTG
ncbi:MAG: ribosome silencing factor [Planctomycetota bacterium]|jgi:ribosome-associated protein